MSVQKKLQTLSNEQSIISAYPGNLKMSLFTREDYVKNKEMFQVSSDREIAVQNFGYDQQGNFRVREVKSRNFVLEVTLAPGTYTLARNWMGSLVKRLRQKVGGDQETVKHGWANYIQTVRECETQETRDKYILLSEGNGASLVNPTSPVIGYLFLNIQTASINPKMSQYYPNYQLNISAEFDLEFAPSSDIIITGTAPNIQKCRVLYEYAAPLKNSVLKSKTEGEILVHHEVVSYEYPLAATGDTRRTIKLRSFPTSEIDEMVIFFATDTDINTNKNKFLSQPLKNIKFSLSDREIIDSQNEFQLMKQLFRNELPNIYKVNGVEKNFYVLDLTPLTYKEQAKSRLYVGGVILSEEDGFLEFDIPTDVSGKLFLYGIKKVVQVFKNGNMQKVY